MPTETGNSRHGMWWLRSWVTLGVSGILVVVWLWFLFPAFESGFRARGDPYVIDLQLSWAVERFVEIINTWTESTGQDAVGGLVRQIVVLDFLFPVIYAVFGASLLAMTWPKPRTRAWLILIPIAAAVADYFENLLIIYAVRDMPPATQAVLPSSTVYAISALGSLKLQLLLMTFAVSVVGLICRLWIVARRLWSRTQPN